MRRARTKLVSSRFLSVTRTTSADWASIAAIAIPRVEKSSFANIPPTKTCMNCHSQIWNTSPTLEPVRASLSHRRIDSVDRVHDLPDFVYFNHSIHVNKGRGLRKLPWARGQDAAHVASRTRFEMSGVSTATAIRENVLRPRESDHDHGLSA